MKETIIATGAEENLGVRQEDEIDKEIIFKNFVPFTDCITK